MSKLSKYIVVGFSLIVGALHFIIGPNYNGCCKIFISSYLTDIVLPMNVFLLSQIALRPKLTVKMAYFIGALSTLLIGLTVEFSQYLGYPIFGSTYDPLDLLMYFLGIAGGLLFDILILLPIERTAKK